MSVLVFAETWDGKFKKASFEAVSYGAAVAEKLGTDTIAVTIGSDEDASVLGKYGASKVVNVTNSQLKTFSNQGYASAINQVADANGADTIIISNSNNGKTICPLLAVKMNTAMITGVVEVPSSTSPFVVKKKAFSSKAFVDTQANGDKRVLALSPNAFGVKEGDGSASVDSFEATVSDNDFRLTSESVDRAQGKLTLAEAEVVVSAGRGLKGPENWGMVEELAEVLNAGTACSKPVSDMGWRPHSEHVGQTGKAIAPNLYIAIGISGAIQHLAGVSSSKVMVAINTDPEAPFFKAADYGINGDAFEVVPKLIEAFKAHKANN